MSGLDTSVKVSFSEDSITLLLLLWVKATEQSILSVENANIVNYTLNVYLN